MRIIGLALACSPVLAATGLRIGELLGLRWRALDLQLGTLAVRESVFEAKFQAPKTQKAVRTIPLGPRAIAALTAHRERVSRKARRISCSATGAGIRCGSPSCCGTCS
jgi:integrase